MPAFLVRLIDNHDIVGFFFAEDHRDLVGAVDECTDADGCEYVRLPVGGIMWMSPAIAVPMDPGPDDDENWELPELPFATATVSETWFNLLYGHTKELRWTKFHNNRKPKTTPPKPPRPTMGPGNVVPMRRPRR